MENKIEQIIQYLQQMNQQMQQEQRQALFFSVKNAPRLTSDDTNSDNCSRNPCHCNEGVRKDLEAPSLLNGPEITILSSQAS
jgi:hypothetical protein